MWGQEGKWSQRDATVTQSNATETQRCLPSLSAGPPRFNQQRASPLFEWIDLSNSEFVHWSYSLLENVQSLKSWIWEQGTASSQIDIGVGVKVLTLGEWYNLIHWCCPKEHYWFASYFLWVSLEKEQDSHQNLVNVCFWPATLVLMAPGERNLQPTRLDASEDTQIVGRGCIQGERRTFWTVVLH